MDKTTKLIRWQRLTIGALLATLVTAGVTLAKAQAGDSIGTGNMDTKAPDSEIFRTLPQGRSKNIDPGILRTMPRAFTGDPGIFRKIKVPVAPSPTKIDNLHNPQIKPGKK